MAVMLRHPKYPFLVWPDSSGRPLLRLCELLVHVLIVLNCTYHVLSYPTYSQPLAPSALLPAVYVLCLRLLVSHNIVEISRGRLPLGQLGSLLVSL